MSTAAPLPSTPVSPNSAAKRKGPKNLPRLPASAFEAPNSAISESFPLAPSPSTIHPTQIVDAHVKHSDLSGWSSGVGKNVLAKSGGVVVLLSPGETIAEDALKSSNVKVLSVSVPFELTGSSTPTLPTLSIPTFLSTIVKEIQPDSHTQLNWALKQGKPVDINVQLPIFEIAEFERFQDFLTKATTEVADIPPIILSGVLPPPHDLSMPIVKLINHSTYIAYQSQIGELSLVPRTFVKFVPPQWNEPTPSGADEASAKQKREWKRKIKMFLGPAIEAFGYERIMFGSSGSSQATAEAWYDIARETFAEMNTEQEVMDAIFANNALKVYGVSA